VPRGRTALVGFSQGVVLAYVLGLDRARDPFASVTALGTYLPRDTETPFADVPVTIAHGRLDPVVDVGFGRAARDTLAAAGLDVAYRETAVEHTIDPAWLPLLRERLAAGFSAADR
jgi:phospholipase/carboxylesterase